MAIPQRVIEYLRANGVREAPVLARLRAETARLPNARMQIAPEQEGALLQMLVRLIGARRCVEVGTFTGYSALAVALALPDDGRITACDISEEWTQVARRYWVEAGVAGKIDLRLAPASETLDALIVGGAAGTIDFAFIDADKTGYDAYYERLLTLLRPGGLIVFDNVLWGGSVADPADHSADTVALRALNAKLATDQRIDLCMVPVGDGFSLCRKR